LRLLTSQSSTTPYVTPHQNNSPNWHWIRDNPRRLSRPIREIAERNGANRRYEDTKEDVSIASERRPLEADLGMGFHPDFGELGERYSWGVSADGWRIFEKFNGWEFWEAFLVLGLLGASPFSGDGCGVAKITFFCGSSFQACLRASDGSVSVESD
jgi:hypothetical protein